ncbi:MAG TPA: hypothetical protein VF720_01940 [Candidatus Eisenbacteria bacterium]
MNDNLEAPAEACPPEEITVVTARKQRDTWDKLQIILQPVGGLFTALAIAILGIVSSQFLERRQAAESNARLYSELMSRREEAESALRKDMFQTIIGAFVSPSSHGDLNSELLNLELLAYNFHESLNLKPLFVDVRRRIAEGEQKATTAQARGEFDAYTERIERVAREIARKQMIVLEGVGQKFDRTIDMTTDPVGTTLEPATLRLGSRQSSFTIDILDLNRDRGEVLIGLSVDTPDSALGRQTKNATFTVGYFDFPMIDNTRLTGGDRCAVVLNSMTDQSADMTLVLFPGAYASLKEKPYYSEVIESIRQANAGSAKAR